MQQEQINLRKYYESNVMPGLITTDQVESCLGVFKRMETVDDEIPGRLSFLFSARVANLRRAQVDAPDRICLEVRLAHQIRRRRLRTPGPRRRRF
jgi:hypothetical protein